MTRAAIRETLLLNPQRHRRLRRGTRRPVGACSMPASFRSCSAAIARSCSAACSRSGAAAATGCCSSTAMPTSTSPRPSPNGEAASMDLALATGRGPGDRRPTSKAGGRWCATRTSWRSAAATPKTPRRTAASASRTPRSGHRPRRGAPAAASATRPSSRRASVAARARRLLDAPRRRRARRCRHAGRRLPHAGRAVVGRTGDDSSGRNRLAAGRSASSHDLQPEARRRRLDRDRIRRCAGQGAPNSTWMPTGIVAVACR